MVGALPKFRIAHRQISPNLDIACLQNAILRFAAGEQSVREEVRRFRIVLRADAFEHEWQQFGVCVFARTLPVIVVVRGRALRRSLRTFFRTLFALLRPREMLRHSVDRGGLK